jgi:hypothetical protein
MVKYPDSGFDEPQIVGDKREPFSTTVPGGEARPLDYVSIQPGHGEEGGELM